ncbi:spidroin-2-like [Schistocerca gregaria]|uniref:spidroin-2-like n=1 Tax=Schistocerca gregaria TaxID=7010 RepID=UPI00211F0E22|nr:spidroin-2-like [Schistocerca gregaria]
MPQSARRLLVRRDAWCDAVALTLPDAAVAPPVNPISAAPAAPAAPTAAANYTCDARRRVRQVDMCIHLDWYQCLQLLMVDGCAASNSGYSPVSCATSHMRSLTAVLLAAMTVTQAMDTPRAPGASHERKSIKQLNSIDGALPAHRPTSCSPPESPRGISRSRGPGCEAAVGRAQFAAAAAGLGASPQFAAAAAGLGASPQFAAAAAGLGASPQFAAAAAGLGASPQFAAAAAGLGASPQFAAAAAGLGASPQFAAAAAGLGASPQFAAAAAGLGASPQFAAAAAGLGASPQFAAAAAGLGASPQFAAAAAGLGASPQFAAAAAGLGASPQFAAAAAGLGASPQFAAAAAGLGASPQFAAAAAGLGASPQFAAAAAGLGASPQFAAPSSVRECRAGCGLLVGRRTLVVARGAYPSGAASGPLRLAGSRLTGDFPRAPLGPAPRPATSPPRLLLLPPMLCILNDPAHRSQAAIGKNILAAALASDDVQMSCVQVAAKKIAIVPALPNLLSARGVAGGPVPGRAGCEIDLTSASILPDPVPQQRNARSLVRRTM